jgi:hypothetical protein
LKQANDEFLSNNKQNVLQIEMNEDEKAKISSKEENTRSLPSWMKRLPSNHDLKNSAPSTVNEKEKGRKKPKLL